VGGYFILAMPQRKVFLHPNLDVYGEEVVGDFLQVNGVQSGWENILRKYHVDWTILPREHRLNRLLAQRADWHLVYTDQVATIYGGSPERTPLAAAIAGHDDLVGGVTHLVFVQLAAGHDQRGWRPIPALADRPLDDRAPCSDSRRPILPHRFGAPLISKEWLSEVIFAAADDRLGWNGAVLVERC